MFGSCRRDLEHVRLRERLGGDVDRLFFFFALIFPGLLPPYPTRALRVILPTSQ